MSVNLTCTQVGALLSFYIDDRLNEQLKQFVDAHLKNCPECRAKLTALKIIVNELREEHERVKNIPAKEIQDNTKNSHYNEFKINLSAYLDNELTDTENIRVKKYIISNQNAREDLEKYYSLKKVLQESFEKTKNDIKHDFSKDILKRIDIQEEVYGADSFAKVVALFIIIVAVFTFTAVMVFWV